MFAVNAMQICVACAEVNCTMQLALVITSEITYTDRVQHTEEHTEANHDTTQHQPRALFLLTHRACVDHPTLWMLLASIPRATDPRGAL